MTEPNGTRARLDYLERRMDNVERETRDGIRVGERLTLLTKKVDDLDKDQRSLRKALYTFALSVVAGALVFAFSAFELLGS